MSADLEFENLVKLYYGDLYRFGLSLTGNETDAADLTQETFYIWANKGHQLQKAASVKGWLFTTLHREFLKTCRRRNRFSNESVDERTEDLPNVPADCAERVDSQSGRDRRRFSCAARALLHGRFVLQRNRRHPGSSSRHGTIAHRARKNSAFAPVE